jgi:hypothetical protein
LASSAGEQSAPVVTLACHNARHPGGTPAPGLDLDRRARRVQGSRAGLELARPLAKSEVDAGVAALEHTASFDSEQLATLRAILGPTTAQFLMFNLLRLQLDQ